VTAELQILSRAHALFPEPGEVRPLHGVTTPTAGVTQSDGGATLAAYRAEKANRRTHLDAAGRVDAELSGILDRARRDHLDARRATAAVLAAARSDAGALPDNPIVARELLRRRVYRMRAQRAHVVAARRRAARRRAALRRLRYRMTDHPRAVRDGRSAIAVRAALGKLGRPYVWGATGPDRFDCSGLVQWAYAQAGVPLRRTTYEQILDGVPVAPSRVRAGDLVFPHNGHVQMAIGGGLVVEAPHAGATVQISRLGPAEAIRRPV